MGIQERRLREKEALRQRILEAASELFVTEGFQNVSLRKIAEKIEYAPSTIYLYFEDKHELLNAICTEIFLELTACLEKLDAEPISSEERLRRGTRAYIEFGLKHPQHYLLVLCLPAPKDVTLPPPDMNPGLEAFDGLRKCLKRGIEDGSFRKMDLEVLSQTTWMMMHGVTSLLVTKYDGFPWVDQETLISTAVDHIVRAVKA